jgi:hypothetical protein
VTDRRIERQALIDMMGPSFDASTPQPEPPDLARLRAAGLDGSGWVGLIVGEQNQPLCGWTDDGRFVVWGPVQSIAATVLRARRESAAKAQ